MSKCDKILKRARNNRRGLRFAEAIQLAECYGFVFDRQKGSHKWYEHPLLRDGLNLQERDGMAKEYQVGLLLDAIDELTDLGYRRGDNDDDGE